MSNTITFEWVLNEFTLSSFVHDIVHIALIIGFCAQAWNSHGVSLKVFAVEAFAILLSSNISGLLSEETFVVGSVSAIVVRTPKLEI